jgi:hypothetical protein
MDYVAERPTFGEACELAYMVAERPRVAAVIAQFDPWTLCGSVVARDNAGPWTPERIELLADKLRSAQTFIDNMPREYGRARRKRTRKDTPDG